MNKSRERSLLWLLAAVAALWMVCGCGGAGSSADGATDRVGVDAGRSDRAAVDTGRLDGPAREAAADGLRPDSTAGDAGPGPDGGADGGRPPGELLLQGGADERVVPHVAVRSDGTSYLSWYAKEGGAYSIRVQRLETGGGKRWAADGVLASAVDSRSWVMDYDLATDDRGNAILVYSNTADFVLRAQLLDENGAPGWGAKGVVISDSAAGTQALTPHVVPCSDGAMAVAWDESHEGKTGSSQHVMVQRLDRSGQPGWPAPFSVDPADGLSPMFSQLVPASDGSVFVVWVENGGLNYPGDAYSQRIDAQGKPVWAAKRKINGTDQLAFPMRPLLAADGQGGFYAAWTGLVGFAGFQGRVQRFDADGRPAWDAEGVRVSLEDTMMQLPSAITVAAGASPLVVGWKQTDPNQNSSGLHLQAFDSQGARLWDDPGLVVVPAGRSEGALAASLRPTRQGAAIFYAQGPLGGMSLTAHVAAVALQRGGSPVVTDLSQAATDKTHPAVSRLVGGGYWLVWDDGRGGHPVIYGTFWPSP